MRLPILLSLTGLALAADPCTVIITAKSGDTCATIAALAAISVSQFLRANPSVSSCTSLVPGTRYCVDPGYNPSSSSSAAPAATGSKPPAGGSGSGLPVSTNGQCGPALYTCLGSTYGDCCSEHGWCGGTADHCGPQCQSGFGKCDSDSSAGGATTVYVTRTSTVTSTVGGGGGGVTQIVRSTTTATVTVAGGAATTTNTVRVTERSLVMLTSTLTTIKTVTITDAKLCRTTTTRGAAGLVVTRIEGADSEGGGAALVARGEGECRTFYRVGGEDSCEGIVKRHQGVLDLGRLYSWNQQLSGDCQGLVLGEWICVGV